MNREQILTIAARIFGEDCNVSDDAIIEFSKLITDIELGLMTTELRKKLKTKCKLKAKQAWETNRDEYGRAQANALENFADEL